MAVSYNLRGDLFLFDAAGSLLVRAKTGELTWLQLFDFDVDGTAELITEEVDGRGTGVLIKGFHIYRLSRAGVEPLWQGASYSRKEVGLDPETGESVYELVRGYVRCEPGGQASPRLLHLREVLEPTGDVQSIRQAYELGREGFRLVSWPSW